MAVRFVYFASQNSIRHNLSLHRRFVRIPHADGKSSWWTLNQAEISSTRWSRAPASRRRADSMDVRSLSSQQRPRRGRKAAGVESALGERERRYSGKNSQLGNCSEAVLYNPIEESANSVDNDLNNPSDSDDRYSVVSPTYFNSFGFEANTFLFNPVTVTALSIGGIANSSTSASDEQSHFGLQKFSTADCPLYYESECDGDDGDRNARMVLQVPSWDSHLIGNDPSVDSLSLDDDNYTTAEGDKLSDLFSDIAMSYDDASVSHLDSSFDACFQDSRSPLDAPVSASDGNELLIASANCSSQSSVEFDLRRGSDAPPPSPECDGNAQSLIGDDAKPNVRLWSSVLSL